MKTICPVIPKMAHSRREPTVFDVDLFLPADPANPGMIGVYAKIGQHAEASIGYYLTRRKPRTPAEREACQRAVAEYRFLLRSLPGGTCTDVIVVHRRTAAHRHAAYLP